MSRVGTAFSAFFKALFDSEAAARIAGAVAGGPAVPATAIHAVAAPAPVVRVAQQSEAITLLATLQREGRLVDFLKEDLSAYDDAQIGAVVRDIHRDTGKALERLLAIRPAVAGEEGVRVDVPAGGEAGRFRLTGKVGGAGPFAGSLQHCGWEATKLELPKWTGPADAAKVIAAAEVQLG